MRKRAAFTGIREHGIGETIAYKFRIPTATGTVASASVAKAERYDVDSETFTDVTSDLMSGSISYSGQEITLPHFGNSMLLADTMYRLSFKYGVGANTFSAYQWLNVTGEETTYTWYVDSVSGSDAYDGRSKGGAFATIAKLETVMAAGESVGLARGSHWREQLDLPGNYCRVGAYGSGARPILDASNIATGWVKTVGRTNVYEIGVTPLWHIAGTNWLNVWEDDVFLTRATSVVNCDATPGSCYPSAAAGAITLYIHPFGSTNPTSDGKVYEYTHRQYGIYCRIYSGCVITSIQTIKQLHADGSMVVGASSILIDCRADYGNKHNYLFEKGSMLFRCTADESYYGTTNLTMMVGNSDSPANEGLLLVDCRTSNAVLNIRASGFYCHRNVGGDFGTVTLTRFTAERCNVGINGDHATFIVTDAVITACTYALRPDAEEWTISGWTVTGACTRVIDFTAANAVVTADDLDINIDGNGSFGFYSGFAITLTVTNSNIRLDSVVGICRCFYMNHAGISLTSTGNVFGTNWLNPYFCPAISALTSNNNCFDRENFSFNLNGSTYNTVTLWKAGTGKDAASTVGGCAA